MIPKEIEQYQADYKEGIWQEYTDEEYFQWVSLLMKRATHRVNNEKRLKDLTDARNYLLMWMSKYSA